MVKHIVMFRFKGTDAERRATADRFKELLDPLPSVIPELESIEVGLNMNPAESWDLVLTGVAATREAVALYSAHPAHVAAVHAVKPQIDARACVDYEF